jgi:hypothetical protein
MEFLKEFKCYFQNRITLEFTKMMTTLKKTSEWISNNKQ